MSNSITTEQVEQLMNQDNAVRCRYYRTAADDDVIPTPPSSVVSATFADVVSLLAMLLVQLSQVFGVHDVRVSLATFKAVAVAS